MMNSHRFLLAFLTFCVLTCAIVIPRVGDLHAHWSGDEELWMRRSFNFLLALNQGKLENTSQTPHPGVITMWVGSIPLWLKYRSLLPTFSRGAPSEVASTLSLISVENLAQMRLALAIFETLIILTTILILWRWLGWRIAILAGIFLACSPTYLAESRKIHTDAPAASLVMLTIVCMLVYLENPKRHLYILLSGASFGLACLAKSSASIVAVYMLILVPLYLFLNCTDTSKRWSDHLSRMIYTLLTWGGAAGLSFIGLWPALWVTQIAIGPIAIPSLLILLPIFIGTTVWGYYRIPTGHKSPAELITLIAFIYLAWLGIFVNSKLLTSGVYWAMTTPHNFPQVFLGKVVYDPHWMYYTVMVTIYTSPIVLILALSGLAIPLIRRTRPTSSRNYRLIIALWVFVAVDVICLSFVAKKLSRYVLAVYPILDILAALSIGMLGKWLATRWLSSHQSAFLKIVRKPTVIFAVLALLFGIYPFYTAVNLYPNYAAYYNPIWRLTDITKVTTIGRGVGINQTAMYLNQQENTENLVVRASFVGNMYLSKYFRGTLLPLDGTVSAQVADYDVVYVRDIQIGLSEEFYRHREPVKTIRVNGDDYVYIYKNG